MKITLNSGAEIDVEAEGRVYSDTTGAGEPVVWVEGLVCYWPQKALDKRLNRYRKIHPSLYNYDEACERYCE